MEAKQQTGAAELHAYRKGGEGAAGSAHAKGQQMPPAARGVFVAFDNDLALENLVNDMDMTAADLQDLR